MRTLRALAAAAAIVVAAALAACAAGISPEPTPSPTPAADVAIVAASATQSDGPLGDGTEGVERSDAASLAALADVLALPELEREDIECVWSTTATVTVAYDDGTSVTIEARSCGATGQEAALGALVADWAGDG